MVRGKRVFVGSPGDMAEERRIAREAVEALVEEEVAIGPIRPFLYEHDFDAFTASRGPQDEIQQELEKSDVFVCLLGERIGTPLPDDFSGSPSGMSLDTLEPPVRHPWPPRLGDATSSIPLTGTLYEFLYARRTSKKLFVYVKGDKTVFHRASPPEQRNFGLRRLYDRLHQSGLRPSRQDLAEYSQQTEWLSRFIDEFVLTRSRTSVALVRDDEELRHKLQKDLRLALGVMPLSLTSDGRGLKYYDIGDASQFRGRRDETLGLIEWYREALRDPKLPRLVVLHGVSGVGKSSLLRAGLAAALRKGRSDLPPHITCIVTWSELPGSDASPFVAFGTRLGDACRDSLGQSPWSRSDLERWEKRPETTGEELLARLRSLRNDRPLPLLIALDQFEQLLSEIERAKDTEAVSQYWRPILSVLRVVAREPVGLAAVTIPNDWQDALEAKAQFKEVRDELGLDVAVTRRHVLLPSAAHVERIIKQFFEDRDIQISRDLTEYLLEQVDELRDGDGSFMPLLSQVLARLQQAWRARSNVAPLQSPMASNASLVPDSSSTQAAAGITPVVALAGQGDTVPLNRAFFEAEARMSTAVNDLGEDAYALFAKDHASERIEPSTLQALVRRLVSINATDRRRSLRSVNVSDLPDPQAALLSALAVNRLAQLDGGHGRLVHQSVLDHWARAGEVYREQVSGALIVSAMRGRAETWHQWNRDDHLLLDQGKTDRDGTTFLDVERIFGQWCEELDGPLWEFLEASLLAKATGAPERDPLGTPRLYWIARANSPRLLRRYLDLFPQMLGEAAPSNGEFPLHAASARGCDENVELLVTAGAPVNAPSKHGATPLHLAILGGHSGTRQRLLRAGADPGARDTEGPHALDLASELNLREVVEALLAYDPRLIDLPGHEGRTALLAAATHGHVALVRDLLARGADARARAAEGRRALDEAAVQGHLEVVEVLLAYDPELLDLPGRNERTALLAASARGHTALVERLLREGAEASRRIEEGTIRGTHALDVAAEQGHADTVRLLLEHDSALLHLLGHRDRSVLLAAATQGHVALVRDLLARGADARARAASGRRALDDAAAQGHLEVVEVLLAYDPELLDLPGHNERTALMAASVRGHTALVESLLRAGAEAARRIEEGTIRGTHALDLAAEGGHADTVRLLLEHDSALLHLPGHQDRSVLLAAASQGHVALVRDLLARGADARARAASGSRALDDAAALGHLEVVEVLLAYDPRLLDLPGYNERTALMAASVGGHTALVERLLRAGAEAARRIGEGPIRGTHALDLAAEDGHADTVRLLLEHDSTLLHLPGSEDRSALLVAASQGHVALVRDLLARGADARARTTGGNRALDEAAVKGHLEVVEVLLACDPELLDLPGRNERTALMAASARGHTALVERLLRAGAEAARRIGEGPSRGTHALDLAAEGGHADTVRLLLEHDSTLLHVPGHQDRSVLLAAASHGHAALVRDLLARGADVSARSFDGFTALDVAAYLGYHDTVELLLAAGADPLAPAADGSNAIDAAKAGGHEQLAARLMSYSRD